MTKRYLGNIITQNPTPPAGTLQNSAAKGVWSLEEQLAYQKAGLWPVPGNVLDITDVFSTYLWSGTGATQTITNGIDLAGEGGLVWAKSRNNAYKHSLYDTERGTTKNLSTNSTAAEVVETGVTSFNSSGFNIGSWAGINSSGDDVASWTFRKAPKFFDVVTFTGTASVQNISHNLGSVPGMIIVKRLDSSSFNWQIYHRNSNATPEDYRLEFTTGAAQLNTGVWGGTAPTDTHFTVGVNGDSNGSGGSLVAYLFAHNDGDGGFGPDGSDIIKCGSYTGNASNSAGPIIDLGFEPQWVMIKSVDSAYDWFMADTMRGWTATHPDDDNLLRANTSGAETANTEIGLVNSTGFQIMGGGAEINGNGQTYIYMAIRRGPLAAPTAGTDVFAVDALQSPSTSPAFQSGFPVDLALVRNVGTTYDWYVKDRLRGTPNLKTNSTDAEVSWFSNADFDYMDGWYDSGTNTSFYSWMWKRAPGYFDVVAYSGNGTGNRGVTHNLGVQPELLIFKTRSLTSGATNWRVTTPDIFPNGLRLNSSGAIQTGVSAFSGCSNPSSTQFFVANADEVNLSGQTYIAYLFSTLAGVSKVGSVSHTSGSATNVDCGFTSGARFILLKVTDSSGSWFVYDTARGIVAGNDARLKLDSTAAENTGNDDIDPLSSGFTITSTVSTGSYIFYAIA